MCLQSLSFGIAPDVHESPRTCLMVRVQRRCSGVCTVQRVRGRIQYCLHRLTAEKLSVTVASVKPYSDNTGCERSGSVKPTSDAPGDSPKMYNMCASTARLSVPPRSACGPISDIARQLIKALQWTWHQLGPFRSCQSMVDKPEVLSY